MATKRALVIGIDQYGGPPNDLTCSVNDADAFARLIERTWDCQEIHILRNGEATVARVDEELVWLVANARSTDRLVLYFSGHGYTTIRNGILEECLVLSDGFFDSERVATRTCDLPTGVLTAVIDAGFFGGTEEYVFDAAGTAPEFEVTHVKVWHPPTRQAHGDRDAPRAEKVTAYRRFGCTPIASRVAIARTFAAAASRSWSRKAPFAPAPLGNGSPRADGAGEPELNGLVLTACLETETAAAGTSRTEGHSAFTHALIHAVEHLGAAATTADVLSATEAQLKALGFRQTPRALERSTPGDLRRRRFVTAESVATHEPLRFMSDARFWEGVLAAAPQIGAPTMNEGASDQQGGGMYEPGPYGFALAGPPSPITSTLRDADILRMLPILVVSTLASVLTTVIPALVPHIVNGILAQQQQQPHVAEAGAAMEREDLWNAVSQSVNDTLHRFGLHSSADTPHH